MPIPAEARRLDHAEIARRYKARRKRWPRPSLSTLRVRELDRLFAARYGDHLPDDDAGRGDVEIMAHHLAGTPGNADTNIVAWVTQRAPWYTTGELAALVLEVATHPKRWKADRLAWEVGLKEDERSALGIKTIGAINITKAMRGARRKANNKAAKLAARRAKGAQRRADYLAAQAATPKPWIADGISRRTWYRRRSR